MLKLFASKLLGYSSQCFFAKGNFPVADLANHFFNSVRINWRTRLDILCPALSARLFSDEKSSGVIND